MNIIAAIPARMASSRLPNKPMAKILGMPMIGHVYHRSKMCTKLNDVYVATCDKEILDYIEGISGKAVMTADSHERATDRTAEALIKIEENTNQKIDIVVMIQGDEPMLVPEMIDQAVDPMLNDSEVCVLNLMSELKTVEEHEDPNEVKVVIDNYNYALYFSREPIPSRKKFKGEIQKFKQTGIILFRRDTLLKYSQMKPTPLEIIESVDMNRFLEHGIKVKMVKTQLPLSGVDTKEDLLKVQEMMKNDRLLSSYLNL